MLLMLALHVLQMSVFCVLLYLSPFISTLEVCYENALYKFTFDIDIFIERSSGKFFLVLVITICTYLTRDEKL